MTPQVLNFCKLVPHERGAKVLEVGSMNVNGSPREMFPGCDYTGIDFRSGEGVDVVMNAEELSERWGEEFDVVLACETLEHCEHWRTVLSEAWAVLKPGGVFCITTPTKAKGRHNYPSDYWRWELEEYERIFSAQEVLHRLNAGKNVGVIVRKVGDVLDMGFEPYKVP